nr:BTB/POZ domain-containing protein 3-like isoform X2 [Cherax quadricarinatus]
MTAPTLSSKRWQCRMANIRERMTYLRSSAFLSDLTITFPEHKKVLKAHRLMLAASSPVFDAMLYGPLAEEGNLTLVDDLPEAFDFLLDYIYCDKVSLSDVEMTTQIYSLANKYQFDALCDICSTVLATSSEAVLESKNFGLLRPSSLKKVLSHPKLNVSSEGKVFAALQSWGLVQLTIIEDEVLKGDIENVEKKVLNVEEAQDDEAKSEVVVCEKKKKETEVAVPSDINHCGEEPFIPKLRNIVKGFLPLVRFLVMTSEEFMRYVLPSGILTNDEGVAILQRIEGVQSVVLPDFISFLSTKKRKHIMSSCCLFRPRLSDGSNYSFNFRSELLLQVLDNFKTSEPIFLMKISSPCISSVEDGEVSVLNSAEEEFAQGTWKGAVCHFKKPVHLVPDQTYKVLLKICKTFVMTDSGDIDTEHKGVKFVGTTYCRAEVKIEYILESEMLIDKK